MTTSRKCSKCDYWTQNSDNCGNCGAPINTLKIGRAEILDKKRIQEQVEKSKFELWLLKLKSSDNIFVKMFFYSAYGLWPIYSAIVSFIMFLITTAAG